MRRTVVVTSVVALLGAGCGGATTEIGDLPADAVFLQAVDRSTDVETVHVAVTMSVAPQEELGGYAFDVTGDVHSGPGVMRTAMEVSFGEDRVSTSESRLVDGVLYTSVQSSAFGVELDGVEWLAVDLDDPEAQDFGSVQDPQQYDFVAVLDALRDAADVTEVGREEVRGVATTRFTGTATGRDLALAQGQSEEELERDSEAAFLDQDVPVEVWVDDAGLIRRLDIGDMLPGHDMTMSFEVIAYDVPVEVEAPPADVTLDMADYQRRIEEHMQGRYSEDGEGGIVFEDSGTWEAEPIPAPQPSPAD